jgi:DNA topoisomerase VI subunit B
MGNSQQKIVSDEGFISSIRDLGLTTIDAINELIDNSFDANAQNIWITLDEKENKFYLIVEDDGEGIPKDELQNVLAFGGRLNFRRNSLNSVLLVLLFHS